MVLLDNNGEPKIFQHEASFFKKGKMMDYETLHKFVSECIGKEYSDRQYTVYDTTYINNDACDIMIKTPSGKMICGKIVLTDDTFAEVIAKTDFEPLFGYCRKNKAFPRLYTASAWCFATPEGSKMINGSTFAFKIDSISLLDKEDDEKGITIAEEALVKVFADAWNGRDSSKLNDILSCHVHYCSSFVFDELRGRTETIAYLDELFNKFISSNSSSLLSLCIDSATGNFMLADVGKSGVFSFKFNKSRIIDIHLSELDRSRISYVDFSENSVWGPIELGARCESGIGENENEQVASEQCQANDMQVDNNNIEKEDATPRIVLAEQVEEQDVIPKEAIDNETNQQLDIKENFDEVAVCENIEAPKSQTKNEKRDCVEMASLIDNMSALQKEKEKLHLRIRDLEDENKQLKQMYADVVLELTRIKKEK